MNLRTKLRHRVVSQFMHPHGFAGRLVGWEMTLRPSNRQRNRWAVDLLGVEPGDRVLEIGYGPGLAVRELARRAIRGEVVGVDRSREMCRQASRRNAKTIRDGRVRLLVAPVDQLPDLGGPFDKVLAVNNMGMWPDPVARLTELAGLVTKSGRVAIVSQPRCPGATESTTRDAAFEIVAQLESAGFVEPTVHTLDLDPSVACVIGSIDRSEGK